MKKWLLALAAFMALVVATPAVTHAAEPIPFNEVTPVVDADGDQIYCIYDLQIDDAGVLTAMLFTDCADIVAGAEDTPSDDQDSVEATEAGPSGSVGPWVDAVCVAAEGILLLDQSYGFFTNAMLYGSVDDMAYEASTLKSVASEAKKQFRAIPADAPKVVGAYRGDGLALANAAKGVGSAALTAVRNPGQPNKNTQRLTKAIKRISRELDDMSATQQQLNADYPEVCGESHA